MLLPTYDVFDEARYFLPGEEQCICTVAGTRIALGICEDAWNDKQYWERRRYSRDPIEELVQQGADLIITINASPWNIGKRRLRESIFRATAARFRLPQVYAHMVGGNDQLVFDGSSFAMTAAGRSRGPGQIVRRGPDLLRLDRPGKATFTPITKITTKRRTKLWFSELATTSGNVDFGASSSG